MSKAVTYYMNTGSDVRVVPGDGVIVSQKLEPRNYTINFHPDKGYWLTKSDDFSLPPKFYGNPQERAERIFTTYKDRSSSTGVMLIGEKGSGKTLLSKLLSVKAAELGMPTLLAMGSYCCGPAFNQFIQAIDTECVIMFDEFEKVFDEEHQPHLLSLFDGVYNSKKLFVLTANDKFAVDKHLFNRPGRMYYYYEYDGLDETFINEYCLDNLKDKSKAEGFIALAALYDKFNFDTLAALVAEVNRFGCTAREAIEHVNARPSLASQSWAVEVQNSDGVPYNWQNEDWLSNLDPFSFRWSLHYGTYNPRKKRPADNDDISDRDLVVSRCTMFFSAMLYRIDSKTKSFYYRDPKTGDMMVIRRFGRDYAKSDYRVDYAE